MISQKVCIILFYLFDKFCRNAKANINKGVGVGGGRPGDVFKFFWTPNIVLTPISY